MRPLAGESPAEEMDFLDPMPHPEIEAVQRRMLMQTALLASRGQIDWPNGNGSASREDAPVFTHSARLLELAGEPLDALDIDAVVELWRELAEQARKEGILSLEPVAQQTVDPFVKEAVMLAADGTEPDLLEDILATRSERAMLAQQETRGRMVVEAMMAIQSGDNPRIIHHKLSTFYEAVPSEEDSSSGKVSVEEVAERLRKTPLARMAFGQIARLFTDIGELARREGIDALRPLVKVADGPLLERGLEMMVDRVFPDEVMTALEDQLAAELRQAKARQRMVIVGIVALQAGKRPSEVEELVREAGQRG